nr:unnamed protein product [Callosobruchus analis]
MANRRKLHSACTYHNILATKSHLAYITKCYSDVICIM